MNRIGLAWIACIALAAPAQVTTGRISGTVIDPQGASVAGARVTVSIPQIGRTLTAASDERGEWVIPSLPTATYRVSVAASGFKTAVVESVKVDAGVPATVNVTLEIGALAETVEVSGGAEVLQTSTSTVSSTITGRQINELPFTTRNALELILTQPGTQTPGTPRTSSINGLPKGSLNITLDGLNIQDNLLKSSDGFFAAIQPKSDAIEEVTVSTANPGAESSGEGAAQVRFVTRSGTNEWHGGLLWQHRNTAFNGNYYFNNVDGLPRDRIVLNQFGGRLGGPIVRDRFFFFFSHEEFHLPQTYGSAQLTVMTPEARRGLFTWQDSVSGALRTVDLYGLARNASVPAGVRPYASTPDPTVAGILDQVSQLTSQAGSMRSRVATNNDYNRNNFVFQTPGQNVRRFPTLRMDANLTAKHQLEFVYNYQYYNSNPDGVNGRIPIFPGTGTVLGHPETAGIRRGVFSAVTAVRSSIAPQVTSEVRFGMAAGGTVLFAEQIVPALFAQWKGYAPTLNFVTSPFNGSTQSRRHTPLWQGNANLTWYRSSHLFNFGGSFTHVYSWQQAVGAQRIPTVNFSLAANDPANTGATSLFTTGNFPNSTPGNRSDAAAMYAMLTGRVGSIGRSVSLDEKTRTYGPNPSTDRNRQREFAIYYQDSWRMRPGLTWNYGVRWDLQLPFVNLNETYTRVGIEGLYGISGVGNLFRPGVLTGSIPQFLPVESTQGAYRTYTKNFSPSLGFAWSLPGARRNSLRWLLGSGGTGAVLRGGWSISTIREGMNTFISLWGANQGRTISASVDPSNYPAQFGPPGGVLFRDPTLPSRAVASQPNYPIPVLPGNGVNDFDPNLRMGYVQSWTLSFQREITPNTVVDVRYVGNHGTRLWRQSNLNEVNIFENGFLGEFRVAMRNLEIARAVDSRSVNFGNQRLPGQADIPIIATALGLVSDTNFATNISRGEAGSLANSIAFNTGRMGRLVAGGYPANFFVVNPTTVGGGSFIIRNGGSSTYNALQVELRRRMASGLQVQASYVWSKSLANMLASSSVVFDQPTTFRSTNLDKGPSPWDIRHGLKLNWIYELPFGDRRRFLSRWHHPLPRKLLEGWEIAGVARVQSGSPEYLRSGRQTFNSASGQDASADAGVILHNMTARDLQRMMKIRKTNGIVYFLPQSLIDNTMAAFEVGGKTLADLNARAPYIGPPTAAGELGSRIFLYGPSQARWDLSLLKKTRVGERKNIELRAQFLNAFNAANFLLGGAGNDVNTAAIGSGFGQTRAAYRDITVSGSNDPGGRLIEFVLRFNF